MVHRARHRYTHSIMQTSMGSKYLYYRMSTIGLMIHPNEIKANAFVDENVDDKYIRNSIVIAMNLHMMPFLGSGLFDEIKGQIENETITAANQSLLSDYIQPP